MGKYKLYICISIIISFCCTYLISASTYATDYSISLSTSGSQTINVSSAGTGTAIGADNITVATNCRSGYSLTLSTSTNDNNLYLDGDATNNTTGTYFSPSDGIGTLAASPNTWGYYYNSSSASAPTSASIFSAVPTLGNATTIKTPLTTPSVSDINDSFDIYYGVAASDALVSGAYKMIPDSVSNTDGVIVYHALIASSCMPYTIQFNPTSTDTGSSLSGTGTMNSQEVEKDVTTNLNLNTFIAPAGYEFKEWNTAQDGTGTSYSNGGSITNLTSPGTTITLYAIWQPATPKTIANATYLQEVSYCPNSLTTGQAFTLRDSRDNQEYIVAKLADGNCWLLDNLRLNPTDSVTANNISSANTNANDTSLDCLLGRVAGCTTPYSTAEISIGAHSVSQAYVTISEKDNIATNVGLGSGKIGVYYNFCAASAGSYCLSAGTDKPDTMYDIDGDLCPAGWHIPTSGTLADPAGEYGILYLAYSRNATNFITALSTPASGFVDPEQGGSSTPQGIGSNGRFWSSTYGDSGHMNGLISSYLNGSPSYVNLSQSGDRLYQNLSIRCVFNATAEPPNPTNLYNAIADMSKGTQTAAELQSTISASNSGVYEYNSSVFGADTDGTKADTTKATIYYYRGILDTDSPTYGSSGNSEAYPNYVRLDDTCWRIIRTTGSGGIKMIYNGLFSSGTTANSCANSTTNTQISSPVSTSTFNGTASTATIARQAVRVGYTHNSTYASTRTTSSTSFNTVFGSNANYSVNNTSSTIKENIESWYNSNLTDFTSILEPNASYCNDRQSFTTSTGTTATSNIRPYTTSNNSGATYVAYFGAYQRNATNAKVPSLACPRSTVDNYSTNTSKGNGQLSAPVALITADEASFAGSGSSTAANGSTYNAQSFLRSGSNFWTMSPYYRYQTYAHNFYMNTSGYLQNSRIDTAYGIRPVISLKEGTESAYGSGTATDPWVVEAP